MSKRDLPQNKPQTIDIDARRRRMIQQRNDRFAIQRAFQERIPPPPPPVLIPPPAPRAIIRRRINNNPENVMVLFPPNN